MKVKTIELYDVRELKEKFPNGFEKAFENWRNDHASEIFWTDEVIESFKAIFKKAGVNLWDYSIGFDRGEAKIGMDEDAGNLEGQKAYNWIKSNILDGANFRRVTYDKSKGGKGWRYDLTKKDGKPWCCEFTGVCYDDDFIDALLDNVRSGMTLLESLESLASTASRILESEYNDQMSEEYFIDHAEGNEYTFRANGEMENL